MRLRGPAALLLLLAAAGPAPAHLGIPGGRAPFVAGGAFVGGGTTWGIVLAEDGRFLRVCEEAVGAVVFFHHLGADGRVLVGTSDGLYATADGGCTYAPVTLDLEGPAVAHVAAARDLPSRLYVSVVDDQRASVSRSDDGGATFSPTSLSVPGLRVQSLVTSPDGERIYAAGSSADDGAPRAFYSLDGGASWAEREGFAAPARHAHLLGVDVDGARIVATVFDDTPGSTLTSFDEALADPVSLHRFDRLVSDFSAFEGARYVLESERILWRQAPGEAFVLVEDGPAGCIGPVPGDARLWACGEPVHGAHFFSSEDGVSFTPHMPFADVEERSCPAGTPGAVRCAQTSRDAGPSSGERADGGRVDGGAPPSSCACAGDLDARPPAALAALSFAHVLARRRRRAPRRVSGRGSTSPAAR